MKVVILAGGFGTRLSELTKKIPKPMIKIYGKPILEHILNIYVSYGFNNFLIATGYKSEIIVNYFKKYKKKGTSYKLRGLKKTLNIKFINTGINTMTGGRLKKLEKYFDKKNNEKFMFTYGDGLSNINLNLLKKFHIKNNKIATVSAVRPLSRYGVLKVKKNLALSFEEKKPIMTSWINGGFFIFNSKIFKFIKNKKTVLEKHPLQSLAKKRHLAAFKHEGFWHSFDTKRDIDLINSKFNKKKFLSLIYKN